MSSVFYLTLGVLKYSAKDCCRECYNQTKKTGKIMQEGCIVSQSVIMRQARGYPMNKQMRQYIGILAAPVSYYVIHEGAHLIYACSVGVFEKIRFMELGIQIAADTRHMTNTQLGEFCLVGSLATFVVAYILTYWTGAICKVRVRMFKVCMYYITLAMLLTDPLYLSVLSGFFGGGDMNGIVLLFPDLPTRIVCGAILLINALMFWKIVHPKYKNEFTK